MGRRVPKTGIRIGNSITWKTAFHSSLPYVKRSWYFEEKLMKQSIQGICRKFNYYVSDILVHVYPTKSKPLVHIKYWIWNEKMTTKDVHFLTSKVIKKLLTIIFPHYSFTFDIQTLQRNMLSKNAKLLSDYMTDKLIAEPHKDKQILNYEFRQASREIKKHIS
jgi:hypothetical protein